jgi:hypothetical protein
VAPKTRMMILLIRAIMMLTSSMTLELALNYKPTHARISLWQEMFLPGLDT